MKVNCLRLLLAIFLFETLLIISPSYLVASAHGVITDDSDAKASTTSIEAPDEVPSKVLSSTAGERSPRKIKRTIRVHESSPWEPQPNDGSGSVPNDAEARNGALTNNVEIKPEISIQIPQSSKSNVNPDKELPQNIRSLNSRVNKVPYKPRYSPKGKQIVPYQPSNYLDKMGPKTDEISDLSSAVDPTNQIVAHEGEYKVEEPLSDDSKHNIFERDNNNIIGNEIVNSGNEFSNSMLNSGNHKATALHDVGNSETMIIDGVGNNKVTKISNSGNNELSEQESSPSDATKQPHDLNPDVGSNDQPKSEQQQGHDHYHYAQPTAHEASRSNLDKIQGNPFVQININGNESDKHKLTPSEIFSSQSPTVASNAYIIPATVINDASLSDPQRLNHSMGSLRANIYNAPVAPQVLGSGAPLSNQPLLVSSPTLQPSSSYMIVQQANPVAGIQGLGEMVSPAVNVVAGQQLLPSTFYLQQQLNQQQLQLQQQNFQQQQLINLMSVMMQRQTLPQMWPSMVPRWAPPPPVPQHHRKRREETDREGRRHRRERKHEREQKKKKKSNRLEDGDEPGAIKEELADENGDKEINDVQPESKSMLSNLASKFKLPDALRQSTGVPAAVDKAAKEGRSSEKVKKD